MAIPDVLPPAAPARSLCARRVALGVVLLAFFMDLLDTTIVNVAIPSLQRSLGASDAAIQWMVAGYTLSFALLLITGGRLGDIFGYRRVFLIGVAGFTAASAACGAASSALALVLARLLQGGFGALMVPQIMSLLQVMYPSHEERRGVSVYYGAVAGLATVSGPLLGALLIDGGAFGLGWRSIFLINVPVGVATWLLARRRLPSARSPRPLRLDVPGVGLSIVAVALLMVPLIEGSRRTDARLHAMLWSGGVGAFLLLARMQLARARRDGSPLIEPRLFRARSFSGGMLVLLGFQAVVAGFLMTLAVTLQGALGHPVLDAGLAVVPFSLGVSAASAVAGSVLLPRLGRITTSVGPLIMAAGMALVPMALHGASQERGLFALAPALLLSGVGMGMVVSTIFPFALAHVQLSDAGSASGVLNMVSQLGGAIGVAVFGAMFFQPGALGAQSASLAAFEGALGWEIATLVGVAGVTLMLPASLRPRGAGAPSADAQTGANLDHA